MDSYRIFTQRMLEKTGQGAMKLRSLEVEERAEMKRGTRGLGKCEGAESLTNTRNGSFTNP